MPKGTNIGMVTCDMNSFSYEGNLRFSALTEKQFPVASLRAAFLIAANLSKTCKNLWTSVQDPLAALQDGPQSITSHRCDLSNTASPDSIED